jgi:hypothetical protein
MPMQKICKTSSKRLKVMKKWLIMAISIVMNLHTTRYTPQEGIHEREDVDADEAPIHSYIGRRDRS